MLMHSAATMELGGDGCLSFKTRALLGRNMLAVVITSACSSHHLAWPLGKASTKMLSIISTGCSSSNQEQL